MKRMTTLESQSDAPQRAGIQPVPSKQEKSAAREFLDDRPLTIALAGYALGFGAGLLIARYFAAAAARRENLMASWGHRMRDAVSGVLPKSVGGR